MVTREVQTNSEAQTFGSALQADIGGLDALALLKEASNVLSNKGRETAEAGLAYLLASQLTLIQDFNLPPEAADVLKDLGATSLRADGKTLRMTLREPKYKTFDGAPTMWFDKNVAADIRRDGENKIEINNIKGIMVDPGRALPYVNVKSAVLEKRDGKCIAHVKGGRLGINKTQVIELPSEIYDQVNATLKSNGL